MPPIVSVIPIMEDININYSQKKNSYIPVDKERIQKANEELRLKRSKPLSDKRNTLESCMRLKYL